MAGAQGWRWHLGQAEKAKERRPCRWGPCLAGGEQVGESVARKGVAPTLSPGFTALSLGEKQGETLWGASQRQWPSVLRPQAPVSLQKVSALSTVSVLSVAEGGTRSRRKGRHALGEAPSPLPFSGHQGGDGPASTTAEHHTHLGPRAPFTREQPSGRGSSPPKEPAAAYPWHE